MADQLNIASAGVGGPRRTEDIALDLMKFIALTTGYGKMQGGAGFSGKPGALSNEDYADSLLQLYGRCREIVERSTRDGG